MPRALPGPPDRVGLPGGAALHLGHPVAHFQQDLQVFLRAAQIPVRLGDVGDLVVVVGDVFGALAIP